MNRIDEKFRQLRAKKQKGFIAYIGAGDPNLRATLELARAFDRVGVDILELGVPFTDPLADGIVNQLAAERGLQSGATLEKTLKTVRELRKFSQIPVVLYVYYNLIHHFGLKKFVKEAAASGVDGVLALDLPPEEAGAYEKLMKNSDLCAIYLVAPTTPESRIKEISRHASGFVYYVSREGVTGMQKKVSETVAARVKMIRRHTKLPVAVGFGISNPRQARIVASVADAVVVGSAIVSEIGKLGKSKQLVPRVTQKVATLVRAVK
jgi:tryptophan synthase alpha chain